MKVYIAGQYARRDEFRKYAKLFEADGIEVTSRWLQEKNPLNTKMGDDTVQFYRETSLIDIEDIDNADAVVFFAEDPLVGIPRGGRHVEFGYALGKGKPILAIGPRENVFHYLPKEYNITHHPSITSAILELHNRHRMWQLFESARQNRFEQFEKIYREVNAVN